MEYIEVYESFVRFDYYRVVAFLEENNVNFQKLHEYRLHAETNFEVVEPAIIRVTKDDFSKVKKSLIDGGFLHSDSGLRLRLKPEREDQLSDKSKLNRAIFEDEIKSIVGEYITEVFYILANDIEHDFESIHSIDFGIILRIGNDNYLSWYFKAKDFDFENEFYVPDSYHMSFRNILPEVDKDYEIVELTSNKAWNPLINERIKDVQIYTQEFVYAQEFDSQTIITDLVIETASKKVAIYSVEEPKEDEEQVEFILAIDNEWIIVVFDKNVIKSSERIEENWC